MSMQQLRFLETIDAPRERVFAFFADHEKFASLFGGRCRRSKDGQNEPNGLGSVRTMGGGLLAFDETIVKFDKPQVIHYRITRGSPLKNHLGTLEFTSVGEQTQVDYRIRFEGRFPLIGWLVALILKNAWKTKAGKVLAGLQ